jgi:hypothetical protein
MTTLNDAVSKLTALGSEKAIADFLLAGRFKGGLGRSCGCPVTKYLVSLGFLSPSVEVRIISCGSGSTYERCITPDLVADFIIAFDAGRYPELVA